MPGLDLYKKILGVKTVGRSLKEQSDMVMEGTWFNDPAEHTCYLYDYWHDDYKTQLLDLHPENDPKKIAISLKVRMSSQQTYSKDVVTHHIQMMPSQEMNVDYYPTFFKKRYDSTFPVGLYLDVPDEKGKYNRWMVIGLANYWVNQFPTYEILPCDKVIDWIQDGKKIHMACCLRSQNSYNSGVWLDYRIESIEDQQKFILPLNSISEKIYYNQRFIIDTKLDVAHGAEPRAWRVSKVNRIQANGTALFTCKQDQYDQHHDYIEYANPSDPSSIVGMWADYYKEPLIPEQPIDNVHEDISCEITCAGKKELKAGGAYKKLTVQFSKDNEPINEPINGSWTFELDGKDIAGLGLIEVLDNVDDPGLKENQIKVRFNGPEDYIGQILSATFTSESGIKSTIQLKIGGL